MSSLWTPSGEHRVSRTSTTAEPKNENSNADSISLDDDLDEAIRAALPEGVKLEDLNEQEREQAETIVKEMAEARRRMLETPATTIVSNHAMGLYELAVLHLSNKPPNFSEASIAIDALSALIDSMTGRLGENEATLVQARDQVRVAFARIKQQNASTS